MKRITILLLGLVLFILACSLPPDYVVRGEFYPDNPDYSVISEKDYKVFRITGPEAIIGYMLSIPLDNGNLFLKVGPDCVLDTAQLHQSDDRGTRKHPVYQADWGRTLRQLADRENISPMLTHFITNHYQRDLDGGKRGSMFSFF